MTEQDIALRRARDLERYQKARALEACEPPVHASVGHRRRGKWRDDASLLEWLRSL